MSTEGLLLTPTTEQRAKMAYVYIRQSSLMQVTRHAESTQLQYSLVERAIKLGWPRERVEVIDEDLGKSGVDASARGGFQYLLAEISLARAGLVLSFDASGLARTNPDWYQLLEVCSIFGTLIAQGGRLYDPRAYPGACVCRCKALDPCRGSPGHPSAGRTLLPLDRSQICLDHRHPPYRARDDRVGNHAQRRDNILNYRDHPRGAALKRQSLLQ